MIADSRFPPKDSCAPAAIRPSPDVASLLPLLLAISASYVVDSGSFHPDPDHLSHYGSCPIKMIMLIRYIQKTELPRKRKILNYSSGDYHLNPQIATLIDNLKDVAMRK